MATLAFLTYLAIVLIVGLFCSMLSNKLKIPNALLLILAGMGLGALTYFGKPIIEFPDLFLTVMGVFALIVIVFDATSKLKLKEFDTFSFKAINLVFVFLLLSLIILTLFTMVLTKVSLGLALIFSSIVVGTAPDFIIRAFAGIKTRVVELLKIESIINTPIIVLLPFIILDFMQSVNVEFLFSKFLEQIAPFLQQIITGVGAGIVVGLIVFKLMRTQYSEKFSPIAVIASALITYILAENLGGNGILAVSTIGIIFGNVYVKQKHTLQSYSTFLSSFLEILIFVLVGFIIKLPMTWGFFLTSIGLFILYLGIRFGAVHWVLKDFELKQKIFMTLNVPKGIAVAVLALTLSTLTIPGLKLILDLILSFMLYSIVLSTIVLKLSNYFLVEEVKKKKK
ncbi:cation:proton antiporter [Nanoarchaeota archaeon]